MRNGIFIQAPFAEQGDKQPIPFESQPTNVVSWANGYTVDYTLNITTDPRAKAIERQKQNYLWWSMSSVLGQYQREGTPEWVSPDDNGGVPLAYAAGATVIHASAYWVSTVANNQTEPGQPGATWQVHARIAATTPQAITGTATDLVITPATLKAVLAAAPGGIPATTTTAGIVRLTTPAEAATGVSDTLAVTPAALKPLLDAKVNVLNPATQGKAVHKLPGNSTTQQVISEVATSNDVVRWSTRFNANGSVSVISHDTVSTVPEVITTLFARPDGQGNVQSFAGSIFASGRIQVGTVATEALVSATRYATYAEVQAGSANNLAVSAKNLADFNRQYYAPINNANFTGQTGVSAGDVGLKWVYQPTGVMLFYTNATFGGSKLGFAGCKDDGTFNSMMLTMDRNTGEISCAADLVVARFTLSSAFRSTSARWKKNLTGRIENARETLAKFKTYEGKWKPDAYPGADPTEDHWFLVADEAAGVRRSLCGFDALGRADSVNYSGIVPLLIASVNELTEENEVLRAEFEELRQMVRSLSNKD